MFEDRKASRTEQNCWLTLTWNVCISSPKHIFRLKGKNSQPFHVVYQEVCSCGESYTGETMQNPEIRIAGHESPRRYSEVPDTRSKVRSRCNIEADTWNNFVTIL